MTDYLSVSYDYGLPNLEVNFLNAVSDTFGMKIRYLVRVSKFQSWLTLWSEEFLNIQQEQTDLNLLELLILQGNDGNHIFVVHIVT